MHTCFIGNRYANGMFVVCFKKEWCLTLFRLSTTFDPIHCETIEVQKP